jgi:DNA-binding transcriptional MerR regulator
MAKLKQIQIAFDFGPPPEDDVQEATLVAEPVIVQPIVINEEPIEVPEIVTVQAPTAIEKPIVANVVNPKPTSYKLVKPATESEIYNIVETPKKTTGIRGRKSIKAMEAEVGNVNIPPDEELFAKQYYPMSAVTQMFQVNHSLLRFWEAEFTVLQPRKNRKGDRLFRPEDIKNLEIIYKLLRVKKLTIEGAKDYFKNQKVVAKKYEALQQLEHVKNYLLQIKANLV